MQTVMLLRKKDGLPGTYGGKIQLGLLMRDIELHRGGEDYILSLRDEVYRTGNHRDDSVFGSYTLGQATARVSQTLDSGGRIKVAIAIEGADARDFEDMCTQVYAMLGFKQQSMVRPGSLGERVTGGMKSAKRRLFGRLRERFAPKRT